MNLGIVQIPPTDSLQVLGTKGPNTPLRTFTRVLALVVDTLVGQKTCRLTRRGPTIF